MKVTIYGWNKLDRENTKLYSAEVEEDYFIVIDKECMTQEILPKRVVDRAYSDGRWFLSSNEAKKAFLDTLIGGIRWRQNAIDTVSKIIFYLTKVGKSSIM